MRGGLLSGARRDRVIMAAGEFKDALQNRSQVEFTVTGRKSGQAQHCGARALGHRLTATAPTRSGGKPRSPGTRTSPLAPPRRGGPAPPVGDLSGSAASA
jgi:hypothetical protein